MMSIFRGIISYFYEPVQEAVVQEEEQLVQEEVVEQHVDWTNCLIVHEVVQVQEKIEENDVNTWYTIEDGNTRYKGEWKNGLPNGKGIKHLYKTDSVIEGNFVDGFAEGFCKQTFEQTWEKMVPYYEGEFKRNKYDGKGEYHYGDGDYYTGEWKDNKYNGQGAAYSLRLNRTWVGEYDNDKKVGGEWYRGELNRGEVESLFAK